MNVGRKVPDWLLGRLDLLQYPHHEPSPASRFCACGCPRCLCCASSCAISRSTAAGS
jgi:hypothetical protein